ncbi:MAG TPA: hypothetical protein VFI94_14760 [Pseudolabrys sp.]|nr:hypothetical protein [Pseudolabrys sp.]
MIDKRDRQGLHMPTETTAQVEQLPNAPDEGDYQEFCDALSASARGRAFLAEYARRNRNADTEQLLAAIGRLQSLVATPATPQTSETIKQELRALHDDIVMAQCELDARILATKTAKLAELMTLVERRIANMLEAPGREVNPVIEAPPPPPESPPEPVEDTERAHLTVVPLPEQPELPIPSPAPPQPPSISLVHSETIMAEVAFVEPSPAPRPHPAPEAIDTPVSGPTAATASEAMPAAKAVPPADPLASIKALSEEERLALFT